MTRQELELIAERAPQYNSEYAVDGDGTWSFGYDVYLPVREAIKNNDMTVIEFIENTSKEVREKLITAVRAGLKDRAKQINEAVAFSGRAMDLYYSICEETDSSKDMIWLKS